MTDKPKRDWLLPNCTAGDHKWKQRGGRACNCKGGGCSFPVYECEVCGDCDYGDNDEAREIDRECQERAELN